MAPVGIKAATFPGSGYGYGNSVEDSYRFVMKEKHDHVLIIEAGKGK